jgi:hypothetical protein
LGATPYFSSFAASINHPSLHTFSLDLSIFSNFIHHAGFISGKDGFVCSGSWSIVFAF